MVKEILNLWKKFDLHAIAGNSKFSLKSKVSLIPEEIVSYIVNKT